MRDASASGSLAPGRLLGVLRSWLSSWPREAGPAAGDRSSQSGGPEGRPDGSVRVLVVDDDPLNLLVISALLGARGIAPRQAADGAEAVAIACEMSFDLILMDLQMPILGGLEATTAIRRFENICSKAAAPVIAYSSTLPSAGVLAAHGLNGNLAKPCDDQDLEQCLIRWCPQYRSGSAVHDRALRSIHSPRPQG